MLFIWTNIVQSFSNITSRPPHSDEINKSNKKKWKNDLFSDRVEHCHNPLGGNIWFKKIRNAHQLYNKNFGSPITLFGRILFVGPIHIPQRIFASQVCSHGIGGSCSKASIIWYGLGSFLSKKAHHKKNQQLWALVPTCLPESCQHVPPTMWEAP